MKLEAKKKAAAFLQQRTGLVIDPTAMFDVQVRLRQIFASGVKDSYAPQLQNVRQQKVSLKQCPHSSRRETWFTVKFGWVLAHVSWD